MIDLDSHIRAKGLREKIKGKKSLYRLYCEFYKKYELSLKKCPKDGISVEIGSGAGFIKDILPKVITTDILLYETIELAMDATKLPFEGNSIKSLFLMNTLHHIPDTVSFFREVERCLKPGGRVFIIDQYHGWISKLILKYLHHEDYHPQAKEWAFETSGPLSGANGALCWIIFYRDRALFEELYPSLKIDKLTPHTPFRYWLSGGLKKWNLLSGPLFRVTSKIDLWLSKKIPQLNSFIDVELQKSE